MAILAKDWKVQFKKLWHESLGAYLLGILIGIGIGYALFH